MQDQPRIAVLLPCFNEEATIAATVEGFRAALPSAAIYVYDNNSRDRTREIATAGGAVVRSERQQGKGHVVRRMFADIDADVYVMADGDLTYDPNSAQAMVDLLLADQLDMVVGTTTSIISAAGLIATPGGNGTTVDGHQPDVAQARRPGPDHRGQIRIGPPCHGVSRVLASGVPQSCSNRAG